MPYPRAAGFSAPGLKCSFGIGTDTGKLRLKNQLRDDELSQWNARKNIGFSSESVIMPSGGIGSEIS